MKMAIISLKDGDSVRNRMGKKGTVVWTLHAYESCWVRWENEYNHLELCKFNDLELLYENE